MAVTQLFVDGRWTDATSEQSLPVVNPSTGKEFAEMACASHEDIDAAVDAARRALDEGPWSAMTGFERRAVMLAFARELKDAADAIGAVAADDMGMPVSFATAAVRFSADYLEYFAGWADKIGGETVPTPVRGALDYTIRHPVGVVAAIVPWNAPVFLTVSKLAPALAAGCTVVLKPSELAPLSPIELVRCAERAGIPPGVLNLVTGSGDDVGAVLVSHPGVDMVSYTGGTAVGREVGASAARASKRFALELGGKSANIVFADADLDAATFGVALGVLVNSGQQCVAGSRVLVQRQVYGEMLERLTAATEGFPVGAATAEGTMVGPLISERHLDRVLGFVNQASECGEVLVGGDRLGGDLADGYFVGPTIVADADQRSRLWREEVFGPVFAVVPFETPQQAIAMANDSDYGLAGGVWTRDLETAHGVAGALRTGTVWVNTYLAMSPSTPFGGHKASGVGREGGWAAIEEYTETTNVMMALKRP